MILWGLDNNDLYVAPSWYWASLFGSIRFEGWESESYMTHNDAYFGGTGIAVFKAHPSQSQANYIDEETDKGELHLTAPDLWAITLGESYLDNLYYRRRFGHIIWDVKNERQQHDVVACIVLFSSIESSYNSEAKGTGLAFVTVSGLENTYKRVGYVSGLSLEEFAAAETEDILII